MTSLTGYSRPSPPDLDFLAALAAISPWPGAFAEIGVYRGGSASRLYEIAQRQGRALHLYDTFVGHPIVDPDHDNPHQHPKGRYGQDAITPDELRDAMPDCVVHAGTFPETLTYLAPLAFAHVDADLYHPTLAACQLLPAMMPDGGVLYFDDYSRTDGCPGVREAVDAVFGPGPALPNGNRIVMVRAAA